MKTYDGDRLARMEADAAAITARYPDPRSGLLPLLHLVQSEDGYVTGEGIAFCARVLGLTTAEVSGVATFYTQFKRHPCGSYAVGVCTNTLCAVMGGDAIFDTLSEHLGVGHDETTDDGAITLERLECNAACDYAPVVMVNWEFFDNQTPESATALVDRLRAGDGLTPTRGSEAVATFRETARLLAGFADGRGGEGSGAGGPTLAGLTLARERGWKAPEPPVGEPSPTAAQEAPVEPVPGGEHSSAESPAQGASVEPTEPASRVPAHDPRDGTDDEEA